MINRILFLFVVCFNALAIESTFTYSCPDDIADRVLSALNTWNTACDGLFKYQRVDADANLSISEVDANLGKNDFGNVIGYTINFKDPIIVLKNPNPIMPSLILHEIGHALRLTHSADKNSIMQATPPIHPYIDQDDVDQIREAWGLSPKTYDFNIKIVNRRATCSYKEKAFFIFKPDQAINMRVNEFYQVRKCSLILYPGTYSVWMYTNENVLVIKKFTIGKPNVKNLCSHNSSR